MTAQHNRYFNLFLHTSPHQYILEQLRHSSLERMTSWIPIHPLTSCVHQCCQGSNFRTLLNPRSTCRVQHWASDVDVKEFLSYSIFRLPGQDLRQKTRGLAMRQRLATTLKIAFIVKVENPVLDRRTTQQCRYINDCFIVCPTQAKWMHAPIYSVPHLGPSSSPGKNQKGIAQHSSCPVCWSKRVYKTR